MAHWCGHDSVVAVVTVCIFIRCGAFERILQVYLPALAVIFVIYYIRAVRQYGRWLLDNFADIERKEVWQSLVAITCILLMFVAYKVNIGGMLMEYVTQINTLVIIGFLLMSGSGSSETAYNPDIFSARRIKVAPLVCLVGFVSMIYAVVYRPKDANQSDQQ